MSITIEKNNHNQDRTITPYYSKEHMPYYPVLLDLRGLRVIVIGGGKVAERKINTLLGCGALINIIAKELTPLLQRYLEEKKIAYVGKKLNKGHLKGAFMVIAATNDAKQNRTISEMAKKKGMLINAVDQPSDCNFILPSTLRRGDLLISVSTSGRSPALAKKIRQQLEGLFGPEYECFLKCMGRLRKEILSLGLPQKENKEIFNKIIDSDMLDSISNQNWDQVTSILTQALQRKVSMDEAMTYLRNG